MARADRLRPARAVVLAAVLGCAPRLANESGAATTPSPVDVPPPSPASAPPPSSPEVAVSSPPASEAPPPSEPPPVKPPATPSGAKATPPSTPAVSSDALMASILSGGGATLKTVLASPEKYRFQVLYGVIHEGATPTLERHAYRADAEYFFPASSMKMPISLATYDRLAIVRGSGKPGITRDATLRIHSSGAGEPYVTTLARETWRALIVSDNFSANRLLGFVGHREVHETLWGLGLASARIHTGFATGAEIDPAQVSPRIEVMVGDGKTEEIPARRSNLVLPPTSATKLAIGEAHIEDGRRIPGPLSFAEKNAMRLRDLQDTLVRIVRPELSAPNAKADAASKDDLAYVRQALGTLPSESGLAGYDRNVVADYQLVPFLRGIERVRSRSHFQIFSKVGQAYGFLIANAYIVDKDTGRSFFLTAAVYANPNETMNDDRYAYESVSFPALADVGEAFCRHAFAP